jgi:hypothetical protein
MYIIVKIKLPEIKAAFLFLSKSGYFSTYSDGPRAGRLGFDFRQGLEICLLSTASRPALWPTLPPV